MEKISQSRVIQSELMNYAVSGKFDKLKRVYIENREKLGNFGGWVLLSDIVTYSCEIMSIELLETIYRMDKKIDFAIKLDCNPAIFYNCILSNNTNFYDKLMSHTGPQYVLKKTIHKIKIFVKRNKCKKFIPILKKSLKCNTDKTEKSFRTTVYDDMFSSDSNTEEEPEQDKNKSQKPTHLCTIFEDKITKTEYIIVIATLLYFTATAVIVLYDINIFSILTTVFLFEKNLHIFA